MEKSRYFSGKIISFSTKIVLIVGRLTKLGFSWARKDVIRLAWKFFSDQIIFKLLFLTRNLPPPPLLPPPSP